jgi:hypothetical protein
MTKEEVAKFIEGNYAEGEFIIWQTMAKVDVEMYQDGSQAIPDAKWEAFVKNAEYYGNLADKISELVAEEFFAFEFNPEGEDA